MAGNLSAAAAAANAAAASFAALTDSLDYLDASSIEQVRQAYRFADEAHLGQLRSSGEPHTNPAGGRVVFLAKPGADALRNALARPSETFDVEFPEGIVPMRYIHKERAGKDIYYFANLNGKAFDSAVALRGKLERIGDRAREDAEIQNRDDVS